MPMITIWAHEIRENLLPDVCMLCGAQTSNRERKTFRWRSLLHLFFRGQGTGSIAGMVPICHSHIYPILFWERILTLLAFVYFPALGAMVVFAGVSSYRSGGPDLMLYLAIATLAAEILLFRFSWILIRQQSLVPHPARERWLQFWGLHPNFVAAVNARRREYPPELFRSLFGDERDDFDDSTSGDGSIPRT